MKTFLDFVYMVLALGNFESFESQLDRLPYAPGTRIPPDTPEVRHRLSADGRWIERWKYEGDIYGTDPLMLWLGYMPMLAGVLLTILFFFGYVVLPVIGLVSLVIGIFVFFVFGTVTPPQTLLIRKFLGGAEFFMNTVPFVSDKMEWETVPGLQIPMRSDGKSDNSIRSMMLLYTPLQGSTPEEEKAMQLWEKEEALIKANQLDQHTADAVARQYERSQVDIRFAGTILLRIDLNRPNSVMTSFFDDFRGKPKDNDRTDAEDLQRRCDRLFRSTIIDAIDTILQTIEWEDAVDNVSDVNRRLKQELPQHLRAFPIIIEEVLLGEAFGDPITARNRQAKARLDASTAEKVALADRDQRIATANAGATAKEKEEDGRTRQGTAIANADKAIGIANQQTAKAVADERLTALGSLTEVAKKEATISVAPFVAKLKAINTNVAAAMLATFQSLDPTMQGNVLKELATPVASPQQVTNFSLGDNPLEIFSNSALLGRLGDIFKKLGVVVPGTP